jgi:branched-chain amino acid transport system ATP-binding protein
MLELVKVCTFYGNTQVLWDVSLKAADNSVTAILGRNGMGKTTIVHSIIGFTPPRSGSIFYNGEDIAPLRNPYKIAQKGIALIPQGRRIFPSLNVQEHLFISTRAREAKGENWTLDKVFEIFPFLKERAKQRASLLSGGEQQMLSFARALLSNPDLILMDEPSEGLAPVIVEEQGHIIQELRKAGYSMLLVEQNLELAFSVADYVYIINKGSVVYESTVDELKADKRAQTSFLSISE